MKKTIALVLVVGLSAVTHADESAPYEFMEVSGPADVFVAKEAKSASMFSDYTSYKDWSTTGSGKYFPMDVAPTLTGLLTGVTLPEPSQIDASKYQDQAAEFAEVVNLRNQGGRPTVVPSGDVAASLASEQSKTTVIQTVISAVLNRPFSEMNISPDRLAKMAETIDIDHAHFHIPGSFALQALESNHSAGAAIQADGDNLLSVIDFRDYGCDAMKSLLRSYFSKLPEKQRLLNESIYLLSKFDMNAPADVAGVEQFFGKRPDAVISQTTLYADHLVRGGRTIFSFYAEGDKTRIVLLSNIGLASKFMTGPKGAISRQYILGGIGNGVTAAALSVNDAVSDLLSGADEDISSKNSCDRGFALGLTNYSKSLFTEFAKYMEQ